jgi:hypothetical protein
MRALSMARPETPSTLEATESNLMPASSRVFLDPLALGVVGLDEPFAIAGEIPQLPNGRRGHEAAPQQAVFKQVGQPLGVGDVGLAARQDLDVVGVDQLELEAPVLQQVPHRLTLLHNQIIKTSGASPT